MKVLVTGGAGFIGSAISKKLLSNGHEVRVLDLRPSTVDGVKSITGSILDRNVIAHSVSGCDAVVHLAAMVGVYRTDAQPLPCMDVNLQGSVCLFEACVKERIKKILFSSSSEVYGDSKANSINEDHELMPKSIYAISKIAAEGYLRAYAKRYGFDFSIVRFFNVYGVGQVCEFVIPRFVKAVHDNHPPNVFGAGNQVRCFCYMDDAAHGVYLALTNESANGETFNIGNDLEPITVRALAEKVISLSGKDISINFIELENSDRKPEREIFFRRPVISKAKNILGYEPNVSLDEGLKYLIEHGEIPDSPFFPMDYK